VLFTQQMKADIRIPLPNPFYSVYNLAHWKCSITCNRKW